jgi:flagellar biosynthesis/type III secretory pathway protein FliH
MIEFTKDQVEHIKESVVSINKLREDEYSNGYNKGYLDGYSDCIKQVEDLLGKKITG